ncbi:hypothetical protein PEC18_38075 [Paucibacter sp. O1-1]|nr:hypothetical protein [Paucibacter sp. O1-1]MDA3831434.1 hypothetical protein [Paucibacter sp. O1-1]
MNNSIKTQSIQHTFQYDVRQNIDKYLQTGQSNYLEQARTDISDITDSISALQQAHPQLDSASLTQLMVQLTQDLDTNIALREISWQPASIAGVCRI